MSTLLGINLQLSLGSLVPTAAPAFIAEALQNIEITHSDESPSVFQLSFHADRTKGLSQDYQLLSSSLLKATNRVIITVSVNGTQTVLMDGFITRQELSHNSAFGASTLTVTGEDVSVFMDLYEFSLEFPAMGDAMIAGLTMLKPQYAALGIIPTIIPTPSSLISLPVKQIPQQNSTDRAFLKELAARHGYVFYVKPGPVAMTNLAYWGPPLRVTANQPTFSLDMGPGSNVEQVNFQYNALAPSLFHGLVEDTDTDMILPLLTAFSTRIPPLASDPAVPLNFPFIRNRQYTDPRYGVLRAYDCAQSETNVSTDQVVVAEGQVDTFRYGHILNAPGRVKVRGAGNSYDGSYYVQSVTHTLQRGSYKQKFKLTREGTGSLSF